MVTVDRRYDIRSINAAARRLLSIGDPAVGEDLLHLVRGAHYTELRSAIDTAFREGRSAEVSGFAIEDVTTGEPYYLKVTCYPLPGGKRDQPGGVGDDHHQRHHGPDAGAQQP